MRPLALDEVAHWCAARLVGAGGAAAGAGTGARCVGAIDIDSRRVRAGGLFVALEGENHDGHDHAAAALAAGATALLVARPLDLDAPQLVCSDTRQALGRIAAGMAAQRSTRIIAITGSNGKTTVKTLVHSILSGAAASNGGATRVYANPGNRNNEIGLPLALIDQPEDCAIGIYEMGAGQPGDIAYLAGIARPDIALVNNIAPAHLERMGSLLGVAETKGAIYSALREGGTAVVNADEPFGTWFEGCVQDAAVLRFGLEASAQVHALELRQDADGSRFVLVAPNGRVHVQLPLPGRHNVLNALAAASLALAAGASLEQVAGGLADAPAVAGRLLRHTLDDGALLIDDSYNANPASTSAAIATLAAHASGGRETWLVLGDMKELGTDAGRLHAQAGARAREAGIGRLFTVGPLSAAASRAFGAGAEHFDNQERLLRALRAGLSSRVVCLVKGSRSSAMDKVVAALLPRNGNGGNGDGDGSAGAGTGGLGHAA